MILTALIVVLMICGAVIVYGKEHYQGKIDDLEKQKRALILHIKGRDIRWENKKQGDIQ